MEPATDSKLNHPHEITALLADRPLLVSTGKAPVATRRRAAHRELLPGIQDLDGSADKNRTSQLLRCGPLPKKFRLPGENKMTRSMSRI